MYCTECGTKLVGENCPKCNPPKEKFCQKCGAVIAGGKCVACGEIPGAKPIAVVPQPQQQSRVDAPSFTVNSGQPINATDNHVYKGKWVAFLLCFFLGYLGFHRFYVGKVGTGILWLLTLGLCGIGWIVDAITILTGSFSDAQGYKLQ